MLNDFHLPIIQINWLCREEVLVPKDPQTNSASKIDDDDNDPALISNFHYTLLSKLYSHEVICLIIKATQWCFYMLHTNSRRIGTARSVNIAFLQAKRHLAYNLIPLPFSLCSSPILANLLLYRPPAQFQLTVSTYSSPIWNLLLTLITSTATQSERKLLPNCRQPKVIVKMKNNNWKEMDGLSFNTALRIRFLPRHIPEA